MPKTRNTRPLQDITDRFVSAVEPLPSPRPRRKVKAPGGTFGAKLRAAKAPAIPSSLPPSSPPSASSRDPELYVDNRSTSSNYGDENVDPNLELPRFEREPGPSNALDEDAGPLDTSDPFGFFVVEKKLKALRARPSYIEKQQLRYRAAPPPPIDTALIPGHLVTPPTPRKRRGKRRALASPSISNPDVFSPRTTSMPSSPSPSKPSSRKGKEKAAAKEEKGGSDTEMGSDLAVTPQPRRPTKRLRRQGTSKEIAEAPDRPVLRRSGRRTTATMDNAKAADDGDGSHVRVTRRKRTAATSSRTKPSGEKRQPKGKGKASAATQEDDEQREKWELERQERLEYFRKLEDYQVEKENVYVV
ncbi:hypothetical protein Hypma_007987 [Hypsizygus marmoreus]|uniref:Uncharacterized protein n=1 Tax=Hypsizygus marmoreus TaxID=39966 RepID=A0A369JVB5_HYPMA|nr:hypothetical protein Hypma_007987 [Hypsizygus marmoreus]